MKNVYITLIFFCSLISMLMPVQAMTSKERQKVFQLINSIDPALHTAIVTVDPTGEQHIKQFDDDDLVIGASVSVIDGLPIIHVGKDILTEYPDNVLRAIIAHELGHYISEHFFKKNKPTHSYLFEHSPNKLHAFTKGKKIYQLPAQKTFALAYNRIKEYEADRSAILDFGINITDARKALQAEYKNQPPEDYNKTTFKNTHPFWTDRIDHLYALEKEVALKKARGEPLKKQFDWQKLADEYVKAAGTK